jgi:sphingomyelin phosphodiesterase
VPASRFGYLYCDSPPDLALSAFYYMDQFVKKSDISFTIFTGDIVSHDNDDQLSRAYVEYEEEVTYQVFKAEMGAVPIYATLGNHDSLPEAYNTQNSLNPPNGPNAFSWNYDLLSSLWQSSGWISSSEASYASTHYGAYAHTTAQGLRIISINTDFYYVGNVFNYWNYTNPDTSGVLTWLATELTACESRGQPAWIIGHVLSGYDGSQALPNPSALFQSIVIRFSPNTIRGVFFGHTHEDQLQIFYDYAPGSLNHSTGLRNTTDVDYTKPLTVGLIGPSITPLTGYNAGWALYQVDSTSFQVTGTQTYFANVSESLTWTYPVWKFEYDTRATYAGASWPKSAPLNASFWHGVTQRMLSDISLVEKYNLYETKSSVTTKKCNTQACAAQKVCYIRAGSAAIGAACPQDDGPH